MTTTLRFNFSIHLTSRRNRLPRIARAGLLLACCLLVTAPVTAQDATEEPAVGDAAIEAPKYTDVKNAVAEFQRGNFSESLRLLKEASKKHAELPPAHVVQAKLYLAAGRRAEAADALEFAVAADRDDPEAFLMLGDLALRDRQITLAELAINHAADLTKKYSKNDQRLADLKQRTLAGQATISQIRGLTDETIIYAKSWSRLDAKNARPHQMLARAYFEQEKYNASYTALKTVSKLNKNAPRAEVALARMYEDAGQRKTAQESMELAIKYGGNELRTRVAVAEWALAVGLLEMAQNNIDAARKIDADSLEALVLAGRVARHRDDRAAALELLQDAVVRSPSHFGATNQLALTLSDSEDEKDLRRGLQYAAVNLRAHADANTAIGREAAVTYGWLSFQMGQTVEAERAVQAAIGGGSISSESAYYVAKMISTGNNKALAIKILRPVLAMARAFPHRDDAQELLEGLEANSQSFGKFSGRY